MNGKRIYNSQVIDCLIFLKILFLKLILVLSPYKRWFDQLLISKEYWKVILSNPAVLNDYLELLRQHDVLIFGHVIRSARHYIPVSNAAVA